MQQIKENMIKRVNDLISESSLSRLKSKIDNRSVGIITAFRGYNSRSTNQSLNRKLYNDLLAADRNLSITKLVGGYVENYGEPEARPVKEEVFFVTSSVEGDDNKDLERLLIRLGRKYDQDSIATKPYSDSQWHLFGTNHTASFPGFGNRIGVGNYSGGNTGEFFTRVRNRPFVFKT